MNIFSRGLRLIGHNVPAWLPRGSAVGNRLLKPAYGLIGEKRIDAVPVWPGVRMNLTPSECISGNLFFSPQLYDRQERGWIARHLDNDGVFVDVGANIGAYSLWAAAKLGPRGRVVAIEADPGNFAELEANIALNPELAKIEALNIGVADADGELPFYHNGGSNAGGHSFVRHPGHTLAGVVAVRPLYDVLSERGVNSIDLMKIDIEGYEYAVLRRFFEDCAVRQDLRPRHIIMELAEGPMAGDPAYTSSLLGVVNGAGYARVEGNGNVLFQLEADRNA